MKLTEAQIELLKRLLAAWPDPVTIAPETRELLELRDNDLIGEYDSWPDGRRRWTITSVGRAALSEAQK